jgi:excisionase family DNA binding protein
MATVRQVMLRVSQVATMLDCSRQHVYDLIAAGDLAAVNIALSGTRAQTRIHLDEIERYIKANTRRAG